MSRREPAETLKPEPSNLATLLEAVETCPFVLPGGGELTEDVALSLVVAGKVLVDGEPVRRPHEELEWPYAIDAHGFKAPARIVSIGEQRIGFAMMGDFAAIEIREKRSTSAAYVISPRHPLWGR